MMRLLRVNEAARQLGCSETWLRRAEARGRIPRARRDMNGWRVYTQEDLATLLKVLVPDILADDDTTLEISGEAKGG